MPVPLRHATAWRVPVCPVHALRVPTVFTMQLGGALQGWAVSVVGSPVVEGVGQGAARVTNPGFIHF